MAVTGVLQIPDPFEVDDNDEDVLPGFDAFDEAGTLGLHLGVLRRFAMLAGSPDSIGAGVGR
jgi:hypothetical protein